MQTPDQGPRLSSAMTDRVHWSYLCPRVSSFLWLLLVGVVWIAALALVVAAGQPPKPRPNIVFLLTDDQCATALGCYGNPIIQTPHIDALAESGVAFDRAFVTTAICMTSRASILTGQYARRHGVHRFDQTLTPDQFRYTYPAVLRRAGYRVGHVGKWHLLDPPKDGFDFLRSFPSTGWFYEKGDRSTPHLTGRLGDDALDFLDQQDGKQPFCLTVAFKAPHVQDQWTDQFPFDRADETLVRLYQDVTIPQRKLSDPAFFEAQPEFLKNSVSRDRWGRRFVIPARYQASVKNYYRLISGVDREVGRIVARLKERRLADNTIIIFTSDHGFYLGERGFAGKWYAHEVSIRVPLVIYDPGLERTQRGTRRDQVVLNLDIAPTIIDLAGTDKPDRMQGHSLLPLLKGSVPDWRTEFFYEHRLDDRRSGGRKGSAIPQSEGVRTPEWKYIRWFGASTLLNANPTPLGEELYDLKQDPDEALNLAQSPGHAEQLGTMREKWLHWRERVK